MPYLRLRDLRTSELLEFEQAEVRIGRAPDVELVMSGEGSEVVSGRHARIVHRDGRWRIEDLGSRNGTFLNDRRLVPGGAEALNPGAVIRFGERGPRLKVDAVRKRSYEETLVEGPAAVRPSAVTVPMAGIEAAPPAPSVAPTPPEPIPAPQILRVVLMEARSGESFEASGGRIRVGRGNECELRPVGSSDTSVSRVHAEIIWRPDGKVVLRDAQSRNGTFLNGQDVTGDRDIKQGDHIKLGEAGPELVIMQVEAPGRAPTEGARAAPASSAPAAPSPPAAPAERKQKSSAARAAEKLFAKRRSFGGKGATVFFKEMFEEKERKTVLKVRWIVWSFVTVIIGAAGGLYWYSERRVRETTALLEEQRLMIAAQQATADSIREAATQEYERLRAELAAASAGSAPAAVVDSLRVALNRAGEKTAALEAALKRAESSLARQLATGDSLRRQAEAELAGLRGELNRATTSTTSSALLDSLRRAVKAAEDRAADIESRIGAARGVNLAALAQANQSAIGLVTAYFGREIFDGSGFAITPSGYFVTNRHVVTYEGRSPDSVYVTMADQRVMRRAGVVNVADRGGPDLAVLKILSHDGSRVRRVDWSGAAVRQGAAAALIGFPAGLQNALDETGTVRTSMSAGIFSKVTAQTVNYDGFTVGGSSGSPIFNANGEVVAVHRAGLREAAGLSFAVPVPQLIPLLPPAVRGELGIR